MGLSVVPVCAGPSYIVRRQAQDVYKRQHEEIAKEEFAYLNQELCQNQIKAQFRSAIMGPVSHNLCNLTYGLTACVGGILVVTQGFDIGGLTISVNYTRQFNRPINEIAMQMNTCLLYTSGVIRM